MCVCVCVCAFLFVCVHDNNLLSLLLFILQRTLKSISTSKLMSRDQVVKVSVP